VTTTIGLPDGFTVSCSGVEAMRLTRENIAMLARIDAALAIHAPCHTAGSGPYSGCLCGQREAGRPAVCVACRGAGGPAPWPCPTASTLTDRADAIEAGEDPS
jgi:hypothetical protein